MKKLLKSTALILSCLTLASCSGDAYGSYAAAYKKVSANGGMCAEFDLTLEMDGVKTETEGKFSLDTSDGKNILYYEMEVDGSEIIQFLIGNIGIGAFVGRVAGEKILSNQFAYGCV